jgi:TetR/AcrR family fatty acid metabolism transcriptional regulator
MQPKTSPAVRESQSFIEAARRKQILDAAAGTIAELGFANASLAQIAKRAGISKSVIGYYFPSKDDLVRAVVDNFFLTGHETMMAALGTAESATELLRRYVAENIRYVADNRVATQVVGEIIQNFRTPDGQQVYKLQDSEIMVLGTAAVFDWGQQTGEFRQFDTRVMAVMLRGAMDTFSFNLQAYPDLDVDHYIREVTDLFVHAARKTT